MLAHLCGRASAVAETKRTTVLYVRVKEPISGITTLMSANLKILTFMQPFCSRNLATWSSCNSVDMQTLAFPRIEIHYGIFIMAVGKLD